MGLPLWSKSELSSVEEKYRPPEGAVDYAARSAVRLLRWGFDTLSGYNPNRMDEHAWLLRCVFLETVAGVPGFMGGMVRHLSSLRNMRRDRGFISTLLAEAENERMHLLTFMQMLKPSLFFRASVLATQGVFANLWFLAYLIYPRFCHRFVGHLEEEAVRTYTHLLKDIDSGSIWKDKPAPPIAIHYWQLAPEATMRDVVEAIRADEANHRDVNHVIADLPAGATNPFVHSKHFQHGVYLSEQDLRKGNENIVSPERLAKQTSSLMGAEVAAAAEGGPSFPSKHM